MIFRHLTLGCVFTFISSLVFADVLFIDLNNVDDEIRVARQEAERRGERFILIPRKRDDIKRDYAEYLKLENALDDIDNKKVQNQCDLKERKSLSACQLIEKSRDAIVQKRSALKSPDYSADDLKTDLANISADNKITTVMISGHDGNGNFIGNFGRIDADKFLDVLKDAPALRNTKSIFTLGCQSATQHTFGAVWKAALPQIQLIAGYENTGYLRTNPSGHEFIRNLIKAEPKLLAAQSVKEAESILRGFSPRDSKYRSAACMTFDNKLTYFASHQASGDLYSLLKCEEKKKELVAAVEFIKCARGKKDPCPFAPLKGFNILDLKSCRYAFGKETIETDQLRQDLYALHLIMYESSFRPEALFRGVDSALAAELKLFGDNSSLGQLKEKIFAAKKYYERQAQFSNLQNLTPEDADRISKYKDLFDRAWLAFSNFDLKSISDLTSARMFGANLRAEAFYLSLNSQGSEKSVRYDDRIVEVKKALGSATPRHKEFYQTELAALEHYKKWIK